MTIRSRLLAALFVGPLALLLGAGGAAAPARAGFQWVAPSPAESQASAHAPAPRIVEAPPVPLIAPRTPVTSAPVAEPMPLMPEASPSPSAPVEAAVVRGFANDVPLNVALRQILPPDYGFSLAKDVKGGMLVSWRGGSPWRQTAHDMLAPAGLSMKEQGRMIVIGRASPGADAAVLATAGPVDAAIAPAMPAPVAPPSGGMPRGVKVLVAPSSAEVAPALPAGVRMGGGVVDSWTASRGDTLRKVLEDWSRRAGIELSWQAEYDYPLQASVSMTGTFEDVVRGLLFGFQEAQPQPVGSLHNNPGAGQTVLVIKTRGNNYSD